jgi:valyl-tRNA synthetase
MKEELPKAYDPQAIEPKWYTFWEAGNFFKGNPTSDKPPFTIVMPPPNVTGILHMGHALVNTLQDVLIRWKRMSGFETLWVPGTDHAGIATQTVVERHLRAQEGKRKSDYSREAFLEHVWAWKEKSERTILSQIKKLGCSCDWSRLRFTMDEGCSRAVRTVFKKLLDEDLIYRGNYLVNWDPVTQTALADDEVEYEEREGFLWYFKYHLVDESGYLCIATTRPETLLGDTAIGISPQDTRYNHLVGKKVRLPLIGREIPIIADHYVDPTFGTGVVKITPAHDPNDYKIGLEHHLPFINIFTPDGFINENGGPFKGLSREEGRTAVVKQMEVLGLLEKVERHVLRVGVSYRSKAVIEPYLSMQWFVRMAPFKSKLEQAVSTGKVKILPKSWEATYFHWIEHLRDWCISRQLWWGHRIPVWYRKDDPQKMVCYDGEGIPPEVREAPELWEQDPDVLDTWFSAALWPFSTLGWPNLTEELAQFYPTSVLITGHDILFFWVARMLMMGEYVVGTPPFPETFLHGLIYGKSYWKNNRDGTISDGTITYLDAAEKRSYDLGAPLPPGVFSKWEKLSKSKGNVIDPLDMIQEYGTDAVRMALCSCANQSPQIDLDRRRFEDFKNFANKVWNGARFVWMHLEGLTSEGFSEGLDLSLLTLEDRWIFSTLNRVNQEINASLASYAFDQAALAAYNFFWKEFCAYYVEITKPILLGKSGTPAEKVNKQKILVILLCNSIRLLHPMSPFITEELFQLLKSYFPSLTPLPHADPYTRTTVEALLAPACIVAPYPTLIHAADIHPDIEERFALIEKIVYTIRTIRGEMQIPPHLATHVYLVGTFHENPELLRAFVKCDTITITSQPPPCGLSATGIVGSLKIIIPLPKELAEKEKRRLEKEKEKTLQLVERLKTLLINPDFHAKAHPELVEKQKKALVQAEEQLTILFDKIQMLIKS